MDKPKAVSECSNYVIFEHAVKHQQFATTIKRELLVNVMIDKTQELLAVFPYCVYET